jgi:hypothetical protein
MVSWQTVLWREWRYTDDEEYAQRLFELIGDEPVGEEIKFIPLALGGFYGGLAGLLVGIVGLLSGSATWASLWPLAMVAGILLGGAVGGIGWLAKPRPTWGEWMGRIIFNLAPNEWGLMSLGLVIMLVVGASGWLIGRLSSLGNTAGLMVLGLLLAGGLGMSLVSWLLGFGRRPDPIHLHRYRPLWFWWRRRPRRNQLEAALRQAVEAMPEARPVWDPAWQYLAKEQPDLLNQMITWLQSRDWLERFTARHLLVDAGGEAVPHLQTVATKITSPLRPTAIELLRDIEQETAGRIAPRAGQLLCPRCLARCGPHEIPITDTLEIRYYGCRVCSQSWEFLEGQVVAVLDRRMVDEVEVAQDIRINWLSRRALFDFDRVEIIRATDEEVERFAVQVGNDTDPVRRVRYPKMACVIRPGCQLSENTIKILQRTFGQVRTS